MTALSFYDNHGRVNSPVVWTDAQFEPTGQIAEAELKRRARAAAFNLAVIDRALRHLRVKVVDVGGRTVLNRPQTSPASPPSAVSLADGHERRHDDNIAVAAEAMRQHIQDSGPFIPVAEAIRRAGRGPVIDAIAAGKLTVIRDGMRRVVREAEVLALESRRTSPAWAGGRKGTRQARWSGATGPKPARPKWANTQKPSQGRPDWLDGSPRR